MEHWFLILVMSLVRRVSFNESIIVFTSKILVLKNCCILLLVKISFASLPQVEILVDSVRLKSHKNIFLVSLLSGIQTNLCSILIILACDLDLGSSQPISALNPGVGVVLPSPRKDLNALLWIFSHEWYSWKPSTSAP